ncbi:MAG: phosphodiester glycosidase family protein [Solirubrobacteraceae bacterium]
MLARSRSEAPRVPAEAETPRWLRGFDPPDPVRARTLRWRRVAVIAAVLLAVPALVSYGQMLTQRSDSSLSIRTVEWLRDNGLRGLVNRIETIYYTLNAPATGGPALRSLPKLPGANGAVASARSRARQVSYRPPRIEPVIHPALPGEGVWHPTFAGGGSRPPVLVTSFRPDPNYPQNVAGVAWIDHTRTSVWLYPGIQEPAVSIPDRGPEEVPAELRGRLVATFNSAFKLADSGGGVVIGGHTYAPMKPGLATIVRYRDGRVDLIAWNGGAVAGPDVVYARQNLPLIVDNGRLNSNLSDGPEWGATLGNAIRVWRSGVGIDRHGNLIYAAANIQTVASLAEILKRAGAVRAMELDINTYWPSFITYHRPGAIGAANLLASMDRSPERYLTPDDRDFFAVYLR